MQNIPGMEVVVVDDGSTDGTATALYEEFGARIKVLVQSNRGVSAARNAGVAASSGTLLAFLDSDDEWWPGKLQAQRDWLSRRPEFGMVLTGFQWRDTHGRPGLVKRRREDLPVDGHVLPWVLRMPTLAPSTAMLRRSAFVSVGGFDESLPTAEDIDLHLRLASQWPIGLIDEPLAWLTRSSDGLSTHPRSYEDYLRVMERALETATHVQQSDKDTALAGACLRCARGQVLLGHWKKAWQLAMRARKLDRGPQARQGLVELLWLALRRYFATLRPAFMARVTKR
jgi:glycosyltransferase involved in cell wall biosynthesis